MLKAALVLVLATLLAGTAMGQSTPVIQTQPVSTTVWAGQTATFSVVAKSVASYYWFRNGVVVPGASGPTYSFTTKASDTGAQFYALLRDSTGNVNVQSEAVTLNVMPRTDVPLVTDVENFGVASAAQVADGFGLNVTSSLDWEFAACKSIGCKWVRYDCPWSEVEIQNLQSNTSGGFSLTGSPNCTQGFASTKLYGLHPNVVAYWGPPYGTVAVGVTAQDTPAGSRSIKLSSILSGSLDRVLAGQATVSTNVGVGTPTATALYEGGALLVSVSGTTLNLAKVTDLDLPAGTKITVSNLLYPPILFSPTANNQTYIANSSLQAFDKYMYFLANTIHANGSTGTVELWNEPENNAECWDNAPDCYDTPPAHFAVQEGSGIAIALSAIAIPTVQNVKYANGWTDTNGAQTLHNPIYQSFFPGTNAQANAAYGYESFHVYGNMPEESAWIPQCLQQNSYSGGPNIAFACTPIGGEIGSNFKYGASMNLYPSAGGGIKQALTETGLCRTCSTQAPSETAIARFALRQFITFQGIGVSPVIFFKAGDDVGFSWFKDANTPYLVANVFKGLMADVNTISAPAVGTTAMPTVTSYSGYYPLSTVSFAGTAPGATKNSIMYLSWQKTYTVPPSGSTIAPPWYELISPGAVNESVAIPAGYVVAAVKDLVAMSSVKYSVASGVVTFPVADNPIEVMFTPNVALQQQSINFPTPGNVTFGVAPITLTATASSGLPVSYAVTGPASLSGSSLQILGGGTVVVTAQQAGSSVFAAAPSVTRSFVVNRAVPSVTWPSPAAISYGTALSATQLDASASVPGAFTYAPVAGTVLPVGNQTLSAVFQPTDTSSYESVPTSVPIVVNASTPTVQLSATQVNFGILLSGMKSLAWPITVRNTGTAALAVSSITLSDKSDFALSGTCGATLAAGGSCTETVTFTPHGTGQFQASLTLKDNANPAQQVVSLSGRAVSFSIALNPGSLTLSNGTSGTAVLALQPSGGFVGSVSLACSELPANASCQVSAPTVIADGSDKEQDLQLTVQMRKVSAAGLSFAGSGWGTFLMVGISASILGLFGLRGRQFRSGLKTLPLLLCLALVTLSGCGAGVRTPVVQPASSSVRVVATGTVYGVEDGTDASSSAEALLTLNIDSF